MAGLNLWGSIRATLFQRQAVHPTRTLRTPSNLRRTYASKASPQNEAQALEGQKQKPKAATQLRRTASASLPIRVNPTPTRSDIQPISILTTAERFLLPNLRTRLPPSSMRLHDSWWVPSWSSGQRSGEVFIFENGSLVCWGLDEDDATKFAKEYVRGNQAEIGKLKEPETEDIEFVTDPEQCVTPFSESFTGAEPIISTGQRDCKAT